MGWMGGWAIGGVFDEDVCMHCAGCQCWAGGLSQVIVIRKGSCLRKGYILAKIMMNDGAKCCPSDGWRMMLGCDGMNYMAFMEWNDLFEKCTKKHPIREGLGG